MLPPNPDVLDTLVRDRQTRMRTSPGAQPAGTDVAGWRVRIGHALIVAGSNLSGERVERPARHSAHSHA
jgi:hypothetical protein